jgi:hypothetical protein
MPVTRVRWVRRGKRKRENQAHLGPRAMKRSGVNVAASFQELEAAGGGRFANLYFGPEAERYYALDLYMVPRRAVSRLLAPTNRQLRHEACGICLAGLDQPSGYTDAFAAPTLEPRADYTPLGLLPLAAFAKRRMRHTDDPRDADEPVFACNWNDPTDAPRARTHFLADFHHTLCLVYYAFSQFANDHAAIAACSAPSVQFTQRWAANWIDVTRLPNPNNFWALLLDDTGTGALTLKPEAIAYVLRLLTHEQAQGSIAWGWFLRQLREVQAAAAAATHVAQADPPILSPQESIRALAYRALHLNNATRRLVIMNMRNIRLTDNPEGSSINGARARAPVSLDVCALVGAASAARAQGIIDELRLDA